MQKQELKYEGKAKRVWATSDPDLNIIEFKDDATAFNAQKRGTIHRKGALNNAITAKLYPLLAEAGVTNHFVELVSETEQLVQDVEIIPVEVIIRNRAAGGLAERLGLAEGTVLQLPISEYCYKSDELGDPLVSESTPVALGWATSAELERIDQLASAANGFLLGFFAERGIELIDIKFEFGRLRSGEVVLADEISPDTCRLWDAETGERLDKDRFRRDLGGVEDAYRYIYEKVHS